MPPKIPLALHRMEEKSAIQSKLQLLSLEYEGENEMLAKAHTLSFALQDDNEVEQTSV